MGWGPEGNVLSARPPPSGDDAAPPTHTNTLSSHTDTRKPVHTDVRAHTSSEANTDTHVCIQAYLSKHTGAHPHTHAYTHGTRRDTSTDFTGIVCNSLRQATEALTGTESHGWVTGCW